MLSSLNHFSHIITFLTHSSPYTISYYYSSMCIYRIRPLYTKNLSYTHYFFSRSVICKYEYVIESNISEVVAMDAIKCLLDDNKFLLDDNKYLRLISLVELEKRNNALAEALKKSMEETKQLKAKLHAEHIERVMFTKAHTDVVERFEVQKEVLEARIVEGKKILQLKMDEKTKIIDLMNADMLKLHRNIAVLQDENYRHQDEQNRLRSQIVMLKRKAKAAEERGEIMSIFQELF
jgi:hypothetical protein